MPPRKIISVNNGNHRIRALAEKMHETFCKYNHTDGCGYYYENDFNGISLWDRGHEHNSWYQKAKVLYEKYGEQSFDIIETLKSINL